MKSLKKKACSSGKTNGFFAGDLDEERRVLDRLADAFSSASLDEIVAAYRKANGDPNSAAQILGGLVESTGAPQTVESSPEVFPSCSSDQKKATQAKNFKGRKQKRVSACTGTVSSVLGKGYARTVSIRSIKSGRRLVSGISNGPVSHEDAEQFLYSMLGDDCQLSMAVIRDVFSQCGYDVEKSLDTLLDLSAFPFDQFKDDHSGNYNKNCTDEASILLERSLYYHQDNSFKNRQSADETLESAFHLTTKELNEALQSAGNGYRDGSKVLDYEAQPSSTSGTTKANLQQRVLESLFNIPESLKHEPKTMNWKKVVEKIESFGEGLEFRPSSFVDPQQIIGHAKEDEYQVLRKAARHHWDAMKSYYQRAATAYSRGERSHAAYLSEQGKLYNKMAQEADEKASREIFEVRNKEIKNAVTIDFHGQQVKQAIGLLKLHLLLFSYIPSIQFLKVITGSGTHGVGKGKLKRSVISLVEKEGIEWSEENSGVLVIRLDGLKELSFAKSESDSE